MALSSEQKAQLRRQARGELSPDEIETLKASITPEQEQEAAAEIAKANLLRFRPTDAIGIVALIVGAYLLWRAFG